MTLLQREIDEASGDKKFERIVDLATGLTRRLRLKIIPTLIDRYDVAIVLRVALDLVSFLDDRENGGLASGNLNGPFGKEILDMRQVAQRLEEALAKR